MHSGTEKHYVPRNSYELEGDLAESVRLCRHRAHWQSSFPSGAQWVTGCDRMMSQNPRKEATLP